MCGDRRNQRCGDVTATILFGRPPPGPPGLRRWVRPRPFGLRPSSLAAGLSASSHPFTPTTEHRTQNTEHRTQNTKRAAAVGGNTQNRERKHGTRGTQCSQPRFRGRRCIEHSHTTLREPRCGQRRVIRKTQNTEHKTQNTERAAAAGKTGTQLAQRDAPGVYWCFFGALFTAVQENIPVTEHKTIHGDLVPPVHPPYSHQGLLEHGTSWRSKLRPLFRTVPAGHLSQHEPLCRDLRTPNANEWSLLRLNCVPFTPARPMIKIENITVLKTSFDLFSVGLGDLT